MWPIDRPPQWVGRSQELAALRDGVEALRRDEGAVIWVEGEPGIGKSSLVAEALAAVSEPGWDIGWGMADQLAERTPLSVMLDCLQVRLSSPDPRRARVASLLRSQRLGLFGDGDASVNGIEVLVTLADELCAAAPMVMVVEDLQWADGASLIVWHQLAASIDQLRLLLIGTCRSPSHRPEVQQVRADVVRRGGAVIALGPLAETDVAALVTAMVGAPPGDALRRLTAQAAGNPLYVRELVDALVREQALQVRPVAEVSVPQEQLPVSLAAAQACQAEAAAETEPARAAAASLWCRGLLRSDPGPLRDAVAHYRSPGPAVQLPAALEDLAAVLAQRGREDEAKAALNEAVSLYEDLDARWDIRRADSRLRAHGIRRGVRGRRVPRAASGWEALTPTELKIATMVAGGASTPDIARGMFLSRRTVQTHISHILAKLGAKGRVDIVREALHQGISA